jgi:tetratricopeptide (TPR) repeat protein
LVCDLDSGEEHVYQIPLSAGDFIEARLVQHGIDIRAELLDPAGRLLFLMDSPNGRSGEEPVLVVADVSGTYRLKLIAAVGNRHGRYQLYVGNVHRAREAERTSFTALRNLAEGDGLKRIGRTEQAIAGYRAALAGWTSIGDTKGQVLALERLGNLFELKKRYENALLSYKSAMPLAHALRDRSAEARFSNRSGLMLQELGRIREARELSQTALRLATEIGDIQEQAQAYNNLAMISKSLGQVQAVLTSYETSERLWQGLDEPAQLGRIFSNHGEFLLAMGQPEAALEIFNKALDQLDLEDEPNVRSAVLNGLGLAYHDLGFRRKALWAYGLALKLAENASDRAFVLSRFGTALRDENRLPQAEYALKKSLELARSLHEPRRIAFALADLAHLQDLRNREEQALRLFAEALEILTKLEDPGAKASVLFGRAEAQRDLGRLQDAITSITTSIALVESMRSQLESDLGVSFFADRHRYYELYIDLLMELHFKNPRAGYATQAFTASERSRSRSLLDDLAGGPATAAMSVDEIRKNVLDPDSVLLVYALGERRSFLWVVTPASLDVHVLAKRVEIEEATLKFWRNKALVKSERQALSRMLFPPTIRSFGRRLLLISPDGALHLVPFSALCEPGSPNDCASLMFDHEIVVLPSASVIGGMRRMLASREPARNLLALVAAPVFQRDDERFEELGLPRKRETENSLPGGLLPRLDYSETEAKKIQELVSPESIVRALGFDATREFAVSAKFRESQILHIATHNLPEGHPDLAGLVFSRYDKAGRRRDGFLRAREIYDLRVPAELVVLSACGTGLGRNVRGEGPMGLTRAFLHAGAKRVVVSLWNVREEETAIFMARFYRGMLRERLSPAAALRATQISMAKEGYAPRAWAGFVLQGEPR